MTVTGRYSGGVVVLDESISVDHEISVSVEIPDEALLDHRETVVQPNLKRRFNWGLPRPATDTYQGSVADELIRQRRED